MRDKEFIICGSGQSLDKLTGTDCVGRHLIAVNRAVLNPIVRYHMTSWVCWDSHEIHETPGMLEAFSLALTSGNCYLRRTKQAEQYAAHHPQVCLFEDAGGTQREARHGRMELICRSTVITTAMHLSVYYGAEHVYLSGVDYTSPTHNWNEDRFKDARMALLKEMLLLPHHGRVSWLHGAPEWAT